MEELAEYLGLDDLDKISEFTVHIARDEAVTVTVTMFAEIEHPGSLIR